MFSLTFERFILNSYLLLLLNTYTASVQGLPLFTQEQQQQLLKQQKPLPLVVLPTAQNHHNFHYYLFKPS